MTGPTGTQHVELRLPATAEWLSLARTTGAAIASRWSFTYDDIADLRLAIDELCLTLIDGPVPDSLEIVYSLEDDTLSVTGRALGGGAAKAAGTPDADALALTGTGSGIEELSGRILDALVDEHGTSIDTEGRTAWLRKRRIPQEA